MIRKLSQSCILFRLWIRLATVESDEFILPVLRSKPDLCSLNDAANANSVDCYNADYNSIYLDRSNVLQRSTGLFPSSFSSNFSSINACRLEALFRKIKNTTIQTPISIAVLGGSLTAGRMVGGFNGAWPQLAENKLNGQRDKRFSNSFHFINSAEMGTNSAWALHRLYALIPAEVDLVIVDYDVNDCADLTEADSSRTHLVAVTEILARRYKIFHAHFSVTSFLFIPGCYFWKANQL